MKKHLVIAALVLLAAGCSTEGPAAAPEPEPGPTEGPAASAGPQEPVITVLAFGDSLTAGFGVAEDENYPALLEAKLLADGYRVDVVNGGISGETSSGALSRVDWMLNTQPDVVIVETGGNDALRGVDLSLTSTNIDEIVRKFTESGAVVIVAGMQIIQNLGDDYVNEFSDIYPAVADKHGAILIPFFLEGVAADPDLNQEDFIHPNEDGYTVLVDHIYPFVQQAVEQISP